MCDKNTHKSGDKQNKVCLLLLPKNSSRLLRIHAPTLRNKFKISPPVSASHRSTTQHYRIWLVFSRTRWQIEGSSIINAESIAKSAKKTSKTRVARGYRTLPYCVSDESERQTEKVDHHFWFEKPLLPTPWRGQSKQSDNRTERDTHTICARTSSSDSVEQRRISEKPDAQVIMNW